MPQSKGKTSRGQTILAYCFGSNCFYFICVGGGRVHLGVKFGRMAFSVSIPSCRGLVSFILQLLGPARRGVGLRWGACSVLSSGKLVPFCSCCNRPLAMQRVAFPFFSSHLLFQSYRLASSAPLSFRFPCFLYFQLIHRLRVRLMTWRILLLI